MPLYDYKCKEHGLFHALNTMDRAGEPIACPHCGQPSARIIMIPPEVLAMAPDKRKAMERNERARHEPISSKEQEPIITGHKHDKCCGGHKHKTSALSQKAILLADGSKIFPSQRPWMISH